MEELIDGFTAAGRFGYEETAYLLMFGGLPMAGGLEHVNNMLCCFRERRPGGCWPVTPSDAAHDLRRRVQRGPAVMMVIYTHVCVTMR